MAELFLNREIKGSVAAERWEGFQRALLELLNEYGADPRCHDQYGVSIDHPGQSPCGRIELQVLKLPNSEVARALVERQKAIINTLLAGFDGAEVEELLCRCNLHHWKGDTPLRSPELDAALGHLRVQRSQTSLPTVSEAGAGKLSLDTLEYWGRSS